MPAKPTWLRIYSLRDNMGRELFWTTSRKTAFTRVSEEIAKINAAISTLERNGVIPARDIRLPPVRVCLLRVVTEKEAKP